MYCWGFVTLHTQSTSSPLPSSHKGLSSPKKKTLTGIVFLRKVPIDDFEFLTRIHYKAESDEVWGEHEVDYILFIQRDVTITPNPNEVMDHVFVTQQQLRELLASSEQGNVQITPWFKMICQNLLFKWWDNLSDLKPFVDQATIHRMT